MNTPNPSSNEPDALFSADNLARLRLSQDFQAMTPVVPHFVTFKCRKPHRHDFVRVREGEEWTIPVYLFQEASTKDYYFIAPGMVEELAGEATHFQLVLAMSQSSPVPFIWPLRLPDRNGRLDRWGESALAAAKLAMSKWVRVTSDLAAGCYLPMVARDELSPPAWPEELTMSEILTRCFGERIIADIKHPLVRRLRGEI